MPEQPPGPNPIGPLHGELAATREIHAVGHSFRVFAETSDAIAAMLDDIRTASRQVWLETYWIADDSVGTSIADALIERATAGLDVRLLYDAIGCQGTSRRLFVRLQAAGVRLHADHTIWDALRWPPSLFRVLNQRNHRKLLVVDDRAAYFGSMNIVATGSAPPHDVVDASSTSWRDVHVRLAGPQQPEIARSFARSWRRAVLRRPGGSLRRERLFRRRQPGEAIRFYDSGPGPTYTAAYRVYRALIRMARTEITIVMAYFLPTPGILRELVRARRRGVRVRVIIPASSDVKIVEWATRHIHGRLIRRGIELYERSQRMIHSKLMIVDGRFSLVGSANLDARSLWINREFVAVICSETFAGALSEVAAFEIERSRPVTEESLTRRTLFQWLRDRSAYALRWWL